MGTVIPGVILVKNQEIRQGYRKIFYLDRVLKVSLAIVDQTPETGFGLLFPAKLPKRKALIQNHIRRLIIVIHGACWFIRPNGRPPEAFPGLFQPVLGFKRQSKMIINMIILCAFQLPLSKIIRVNKSLTKQLLRFGKRPFRKHLFRHLQQCKSILGRHLTLAALPWMKSMTHNLFIGPLMVPGQIYQCNILNVQIIPLFNQFSVLLIILQPSLKRPSQLLIQLIQFQKNPHIFWIQGKGLFHGCFCLFNILLFIVIGKGQIPMYRGEIRICRSRFLPERQSFLPLQPVIIQTSQIISCLRPASALHGKAQHADVLQLIGKTIIR